MNNIFEKATRQKLRFTTAKGNITTEDLWDLSLQDLDSVARGVNKRVKESQEESFITTQSSGDRKASLALEVLKSIINTKLEDKKRSELKAARKEKESRILSIIAEKQDEALANKSIKALEAELAKIGEEEEELEEA